MATTNYIQRTPLQKAQDLITIKQKNLQTQEVSLALNETEKKIVAAGADIKFHFIEEKKQEKVLRDAIIKISAMVGIKNYPDAGMFNVILQFIRRNYQLFTINELILAFELNILDKYEQRFEHYQEFNLNYVTKVLNAFLRPRIEANNHFEKSLPQQKEPESPPATPEQVKQAAEKIQETISKLSHKSPLSVPRINNHKFFDPIQNQPDRKELMEKIIPRYTLEQLDDTLEHYQSKLNEYRATNKVEYVNIITDIIREIELEQELRRQNVLHKV